MFRKFSIEEELRRIETYLDQLAEISPEGQAKAANFIYCNFLPEEDPPAISYLLAANYLKWWIGKGTPKEEFFRACKCADGWVEKPDGTVYPCDRCRSDDLWWKDRVDEDWAPT